MAASGRGSSGSPPTRWRATTAASPDAGVASSSWRAASRASLVPTTPRRMIGRMIGPVVLDALSQLGERYQEVITLRFLAGMSSAETADALGITRAHVAVLSHRAIGALRAAVAAIEAAAPRGERR
jgi:DNA-directed RNA polymerase specialized sigma24 family protein